MMHFVPERLAVEERPPQTDAEWDAALELYGKDRDDPLYRSAPRPAHAQSHSAQPTTSSVSSSANSNGNSSGSGGGAGGGGGGSRYRPLIPRRGMAASDDEDAADIDPSSSMRARKLRAFGVSGTIGAPPVCGSQDADQWDAAAERKRLRAFYEKEGWLPGPEPAYQTKVRRRKVIRRLGLSGDADDVERRTIITNYMEMAQQMFDVETVGFGLLREDGGYRYSMDPDIPPLMCPHDGIATTHVVLATHAQCCIIPDMARDWRTRANPLVRAKGARFMAGAPLLYTRHDPPVVFGALVLFDSRPRETFTEREQGLLMRLSNMLVFQLATYQSEVMAEKAAFMYEQSLAFMRRSVVPKRQVEHDPTPRKTEQSIATRRKKKSAATAAAALKGAKHVGNGARSAKQSTPATPEDAGSGAEAELPPLVVKSGPKEQLAARARAESNDSDLYQDSADTLRGILGARALAMYDMDPFQLFFRQTDSTDLALDTSTTDQSSPLHDFMHGKPWPANMLPVVHHTASKGVLAVSGDLEFDLAGPDVADTVAQLLVAYLQTRCFWWDRSCTLDSPLGQRVAALFPAETQTLLVTFMFTFDGRIRHMTLAAWDKPPAKFEESSTLSLPFIQVLNGLGVAALSFRKVRAMEQSQISYSNLQAHELRTPLHQILAITQLLRSAMLDLAETPPSCASYMNSVQQIRDLIPILDAIDTSGKTLHGIVDNILSFLDLKARDVSPTSPRLFDVPSGGRRLLGDMLEEVVRETHEENARSKRSAMMPNAIETILEIDPDLREFTEDAGGALHRAIGKILSNAYKFIEGEGCVEIRVTDPFAVGCKGVCRTRRVQIEITDNGPGMDAKFVRDHLGEPWAKQDAFTTGSGLSVHLAYRIIDLLGGHMEIRSAPNRGCLVRIEVPVEARVQEGPGAGAGTGAGVGVVVESPEAIERPMPQPKRVALLGFNIPARAKAGLPRLGEALGAQLVHAGAVLVPLQEADIIVADGHVEEIEQGKLLMESAADIVVLTMPEHEPHPAVLARAAETHARVRRVGKPVMPSTIRWILSPSPRASAAGHVDFRFPGAAMASMGAGERRFSLASSASASDAPRTPPLLPKSILLPEVARLKPEAPAGAGTGAGAGAGVVPPPSRTRDGGHTPSSSGNWRPKGMCMEEAVAALCVGDYFSSARRASLRRVTSHGSAGTSGTADTGTGTGTGTADGTEVSTPATSYEGVFSPDMGSEAVFAPAGGMGKEQEEVEEEEQVVKVLVVEDNMINRKILVKILSTKLPIEIHEAVDGVEAVETFAKLSGPVVVLLDINMPRKDGFEACAEMRAMERDEPARGRAQIIAVTALSAEGEKRHGHEAGFDKWAVKPCGKATITKLVQEARRTLLGIQEIEPDVELRRYTM